MNYQIQNGPLPPGADKGEARGRKSSYPLKALRIGEWIAVPREEEKKLFRASGYAVRKYGYKFRAQIDETCRYWCLIRIA